jgi:hypothetical protein
MGGGTCCGHAATNVLMAGARGTDRCRERKQRGPLHADCGMSVPARTVNTVNAACAYQTLGSVAETGRAYR